MSRDDEMCLQSSDAGICRDFAVSYFYNSLTYNCEQFLYGGCGGNRNRFATLERCWQRCGHLGQERQRSGRFTFPVFA